MTAPETFHLDADTLADLAEDLLDGSEAEAARRHVESCALCSGDYALISGAAQVAWDTIEPEPVPADVVARVEATLHREPSLKPSPHPAAVPEARRPTRSRRFALAFKVLAASTAVLVVGYGGVRVLSGGMSESKSSATSASAKSPENAIQHYDAQSNSSGGAPAAGPVSPEQRAQQLLSSPAKNTTQDLTVPTMAAAAGSTVSPQEQSDCWQAIHPGVTLLRSTSFAYQGQQTELLVFEVIGAKDRAEVVVAGFGCPAPILYTSTVAVPQ